MSTIALIICSIFVFYMLRLECKQSTDVTFAFWVPTLWMVVLFSKPLSFWFQAGAATMEEGSAFDRTYLLILLCIGLIILVKRKFNLSSAMKENTWLFVLIGYMLFSCLWADEPFVSFKRWSRELVSIVMAFVVATEPYPQKALESLFRRTIYILIPFSILFINYFGEYGRLYIHHSGDLMWIGAATHKNQLIQLCIFSILFLIWTLIRKGQGHDVAINKYQRYFDVFILLITFYIMGGPHHTATYSATSTIALTFGLLVLFGLNLKKKRGTILGQTPLMIIMACIIIYGTVTPMIGKLSLIDISSAVGRKQDLTGRSEVWRQLVPVAMSKPIVGHGFGGFWTTQIREKFDIPEAHNGYLDTILELGFIGLMLYSIFLLSCIRKAQRVMIHNYDWGALCICYLLMGVVLNITETAFNSFTSKFSVIILLMMVASTTSSFNTAEVPRKGG